MSNKDNGWPIITQIFQQAKPDNGGTFATLWFFVSRGMLVLAALKLISLIM
jgi:hypothetical protein